MSFLRKVIIACIIFTIGAMVGACKNNGPADFQEDIYYEYKLFNLLDDYPSLYAMVESLDQYKVNHRLARAVNNKLEEYIAGTRERNKIIKDTGDPLSAVPGVGQSLQNTLYQYRGILERIIEQDARDREKLEGFNYADSFFSLLDDVRNEDLGIASDLAAVLRAAKNYGVENFTLADMQAMLDKKIDDTVNDPNFGLIFDHSVNSKAKSSIQCDHTIWLKADGTIDPTYDHSDGGVRDLGVGNLVLGKISKLMALNDIIHDQDIRDEIYEILREYGKFSNATISGTSRGMKEIVKDYKLITEKYFTKGGLEYEKGVPYGGSITASNIISNAEARQISLSMNAASISQLLRSDRDSDGDGYSDGYIASVDPTRPVTDPNYEGPQNRNYLLDLLIQNLRRMNWDPNKARLEESLYDLIRFDLHGRDRKTDGDAWSVAYLESLLFLGGVCQNTGWEDGGSNGEVSIEPHNEHGHGNATEILSFNDALLSMGVLQTVAAGSIKSSIYDAAFPTNGRVARSISSFTNSQMGSYRFDYSSNYSIQSFLAGPSAGEMGLPDGGNPGGNPPGENNYRPFTGDSLGDRNMTRWTYYNIIRACWHGEGPYYYAPTNAPTISADLDGNGVKQWSVYYRPNGLIYAYVHKVDPSAPSTWLYVYPADGHDRDDGSTGAVNDGRGRTERFNRFRHTWYSDYYMVRMSTNGVGGNIRYVVPTNNGITNNYHVGSSATAGRFVFHEILQPNLNNTRECASYEEAVYRNYVWVMNEKKFVVVLPLSLLATLNISGGGFKIVEANGTAGLTNARRYFNNESMNHVWIRRGNSGNHLGISDIPGDYRQSVYWNEGYTVFGIHLDLTKVWTSTLWGTSTPPTASHAAPAITRFAFPRFEKEMTLDFFGGSPGTYTFGVSMGSGPDWFQANDEDYNWNRRNGLLPVFVSLLGTIWDHQNRNFINEKNRDVSFKRFRRFAQNTVTLLTPRFYYITPSSSNPSYMRNSWIPRIRGGGVDHQAMHTQSWDVAGAQGHHIDSVSDIRSNPFAWFGGLDQRTYFQPEPMVTLLNRLYDSDMTDGADADDRCNGMLALLTEYNVDEDRDESDNPTKTRILTRMFSILIKLAGKKYDDPSDYDPDNHLTWGARRKLFFAMEQSAAGNRGTKGHVARLVENKPYGGIVFPGWMFVNGETTDSDGEYNSYSNVRNDEPVLDDALRVSIGWDDPSDDPDNDPDIGIGLAAIDEWDAADWDLFNKKMTMAAELSKAGSKYNVTERLISIIEKVVTKVYPTNDQIKALVHTIGIANTEWDSGTNMWKPATEKKEIAMKYNIRKLELSRDNVFDGAVVSRELAMAGGVIEYVLETMDADNSTEELFNDLHRFLNDPLIADPDSSLWNDIVDMTGGQADLMERCSKSLPSEFYEELGLQYNGPTVSIDDIDYYGDWGQVFSR